MLLNTKGEVKSSNLMDLYKILIRFDRIGKPPYSMGLMMAVEQALRLGCKGLTTVEFGVFKGDGLRELANAAVLLAEASGLHITVVGFDTGVGMPSPLDYRDHPEIWPLGDLAMPDPKEILESMPRSPSLTVDLVLGDVNDTVPSYLIPKLTKESPLGFVAIDLDVYSSTKNALKCLLSDPECYLPAVPVYFDDIEYHMTVSSRTGEGLAIKEFNEITTERFIERKAVRTQYPPKLWHQLMYFCQIFNHPARDARSKIDLNINVLSF